jgi:hypothetical protein
MLKKLTSKLHKLTTYLKMNKNWSRNVAAALDGSGWLTSRPGRFTPGDEPRYRFNSKLGWAQSRSERFGKEKIFFNLPGFQPRTV